MNSKSSSIRRWLAVGSLVTFAFALCVVGARTQSMGKTYTVTITPATPPTVSPDPVTISKSAGDQVKWVCPQCTSGFSVHFPNGTPFASDTYDNQHSQSGHAAKVGTFQYRVTIRGGSSADPSVIVH